MSVPASKTTTKTTERWTREDVFELLLALNLNIGDISPQTDRPKHDEMKLVILSATALLSRSMKTESSALRLENKLAALWKELGDPTGDKKPYALYQYGAFTKTLPGLEDLKKGFPGMLNEIAEELRKQQTSRISVSRSVPEKQRRSQRTMVRDASLDPIMCRCGFTQYIACIHCDHCFTWQHAICYYNTETDEDLPKEHSCDDCAGISNLKISANDVASADDLVRTLGRLSVHSNTNRRSTPPQGNLPPTNDLPQGSSTLGPFGLPRDGNFFWGPADDEVASTMERIASGIRQLVYSLLNVGVSVPRLKNMLAQGEGVDLGKLLEHTHGTTFEAKVKGLVSQPVRSGVKIARMFTGLIGAIVIHLVFKRGRARSQSVDEMLYHFLCRNVLEMNGPQVLRDLRRKTLLSLLGTSHSSQFAAVTAEQADALADQLLRMLHEMLPTTHGLTKHLAVEEQIRLWRKILGHAFAMSLKLKTQLALSERLYELYTPSIDARTSGGLMVDECGEEIEDGKTIEICLMPAVVEYEAQDLGMDFNDFLLLPTDDIFVTTEPERRSRGHVVSPAIVVLSP